MIYDLKFHQEIDLVHSVASEYGIKMIRSLITLRTDALVDTNVLLGSISRIDHSRLLCKFGQEGVAVLLLFL